MWAGKVPMGNESESALLGIVKPCPKEFAAGIGFLL